MAAAKPSTRIGPVEGGAKPNYKSWNYIKTQEFEENKFNKEVNKNFTALQAVDCLHPRAAQGCLSRWEAVAK